MMQSWLRRCCTASADDPLCCVHSGHAATHGPRDAAGLRVAHRYDVVPGRSSSARIPAHNAAGSDRGRDGCGQGATRLHATARLQPCGKAPKECGTQIFGAGHFGF